MVDLQHAQPLPARAPLGPPLDLHARRNLRPPQHQPHPTRDLQNHLHPALPPRSLRLK
jgi:hypothetical protein